MCLRSAPPKPAALPVVQKANKGYMTPKEKRQWAKRNPYLYQLQQQRKAVNVKRQAELRAQQEEANGTPVHGKTTPWIESLDSAGQAEMSSPPLDEDGNPVEAPHALPTDKHILNYGVRQSELEEAIEQSYHLTAPLVPEDTSTIDPVSLARLQREHEAAHAKRAEAVRRITSLEQANSPNRLSANVRRIIETFGRHNTDQTLRPKPKSLITDPIEPTPRGGPDTGSSEVQIAILTAKIRALALELEAKGRKDKHNKRNLRVLVHRRQKLMRYMWRKEKGSERWTHMMEKLGLTDACWKGEITM